SSGSVMGGFWLCVATGQFPLKKLPSEFDPPPRSLTPAPLPLGSMKMTPASSMAFFTAMTLDMALRSVPRDSMSFIVGSETLDAFDKSFCVQPRSALAAFICPASIIRRPQFVIRNR
ncbi:hypothetical protein, partial [Mesorhizobium sp.]|uniref:hypothetical protein n=1 Tax=Mesorhizobium sp. TaxID=1871066 RepID=UPI0025CBC66C